MTEKTLGIDFGSSGIKIAEVHSVKGGAPIVIKQTFLPFDPGVINAGGIKEEDIGKVAMALKSHLAKHKFGTKEAIMGLSAADEVFANRAAVPWHTPKEFRTGINFDVAGDKSLLVGVPDEAELDAVVFGEFEDSSTGLRKLDVFLVGVATRLVETQAAILKKAGLNAAGADLAGLAALRAARTVRRSPDNLDILVDIGQEVLTVLIHDSGKPYALTLQRGYAGKDVDVRIGQALRDEDPLRIAQEKAAKTSDTEVRTALDEYSYSVSTAIESAIGTYLSTRKGQAGVAGITLIGGGALLKTLPESLNQVFQVPVVIGQFDPEIGGNPDRYHQGSSLVSSDFMVAVGLAMGAAA